MTKLNKYKNNIEETLDLHGFTLDEARDELPEFLLYAERSNIKRVKIITGKGIHSNGEAKIRPFVKKYLIDNGYIFRDANINDGSYGAIYVNL